MLSRDGADLDLSVVVWAANCKFLGACRLVNIVVRCSWGCFRCFRVCFCVYGLIVVCLVERGGRGVVDECCWLEVLCGFAVLCWWLGFGGFLGWVLWWVLGFMVPGDSGFLNVWVGRSGLGCLELFWLLGFVFALVWVDWLSPPADFGFGGGLI